MKFQKGDKVAVLDDVLNGVVVNVQENLITIVEESGFEMTFQKKELVKTGASQFELSKFSDINNALLLQKINASEKSKKKQRKVSKKEAVSPALEVDLHIQHLVKNSRGMSNFEILNLQLDTAKHKLEFAIRKRISKLVFIHGVGEGVLERELKYLLAKYPVKLVEASYQKYGLGATEVHVLQRKN